MDLGMQDRVFIITGGSGGLGRATAKALVDEGARLVISGRDRDSLDAALGDLGERVVGVQADNADPGTAVRLVDTARASFGRLDGALISVGGPPAGSVMDKSDEEWHHAFESVFLGAVRIARTVASSLGSGGSIAFVLSSSARSPVPDLAISNGLRPGLAMVAKTMSDELGERNIRVNGLLPGRIATSRIEWLDNQTGDPGRARQTAVQAIPLGRYGEPEEFGRAAAFLLSPAASYLTGVMLPVDGGLLRAL